MLKKSDCTCKKLIKTDFPEKVEILKGHISFFHNAKTLWVFQLIKFIHTLLQHCLPHTDRRRRQSAGEIQKKLFNPTLWDLEAIRLEDSSQCLGRLETDPLILFPSLTLTGEARKASSVLFSNTLSRNICCWNYYFSCEYWQNNPARKPQSMEDVEWVMKNRLIRTWCWSRAKSTKK